MKTTSLFIAVGFLLHFPMLSKAQQKYESEYRMKSEMVPQSAKQFIDSIGYDSKIRWYKEISLDAITFEAKFKRDRELFSVEFDTLGTLQDVEFVIKTREMIPEVHKKIEIQLDSLFQSWKFRKIQKNYSGINTDIVSSIRKKEPSNSIKVSYEIVLRGKKLGFTRLYEITFDEKGTVETVLEIIQDKVDHLEY